MNADAITAYLNAVTAIGTAFVTGFAIMALI